MKIAIMQPYIFPYLGYFQLVACVDKFVVYDDVNFIKQGWIARNRILVNGKPHFFTINLQAPSSFKKINEIPIHEKLYSAWKPKFYQTLRNSYLKAPFYNETLKMMQAVFDSGEKYISGLASKSIQEVCHYLNISTEIVMTSALYGNDYLKGKDRVLDICKIEKANTYINLPGGTELYNSQDFLNQGITLRFIQPRLGSYLQFDQDFVPHLSIIDVLMFNPPEKCKEFILEYELVNG